MLRTVDKAFAYITFGGHLLVFEHVGIPEAGIQVPAGTIDNGESPNDAVIREATEETGLSAFGQVAFLGIAEFDVRPFGKDELHRRHFFQHPLSDTPIERWRHCETDASDQPGVKIEFELYWLLFSDSAELLAPGHGIFVSKLSNSNEGRMEPPGAGPQNSKI